MEEARTAYPKWKILAWRFIRTAMAAGITQVLLIKINFEDPQQAFWLVVNSFFAGFLVALGKALRDWLSDNNPKAMIQKMPV